MEETIIKILTLLGGLIAGWSLGYVFCDVVTPILKERHNEKMKKKLKESQKTWTYTTQSVTHPKIEIELHGGKPEFDLVCRVGERLIVKYELDKVVVIERQDNGHIKQYETIKKEKMNDKTSL